MSGAKQVCGGVTGEQNQLSPRQGAAVQTRFLSGFPPIAPFLSICCAPGTEEHRARPLPEDQRAGRTGDQLPPEPEGLGLRLPGWGCGSRGWGWEGPCSLKDESQTQGLQGEDGVGQEEHHFLPLVQVPIPFPGACSVDKTKI